MEWPKANDADFGESFKNAASIAEVGGVTAENGTPKNECFKGSRRRYVRRFASEPLKARAIFAGLTPRMKRKHSGKSEEQMKEAPGAAVMQLSPGATKSESVQDR